MICIPKMEPPRAWPQNHFTVEPNKPLRPAGLAIQTLFMLFTFFTADKCYRS